MMVQDWRDLPPSALAPLYSREQTRWRDTLGWDTAGTWHTVELGRTTWGLPGLVCRAPDGAINGWTFYLSGDAAIDVGGLTADTASATERLLDALVERAGAPARLRGLLYADAPDLIEALERRGIPVSRYGYCVRKTSGTPLTQPCGVDVGQWHDDEIEESAALLHDAYGEAGALVVPDPTRSGWRNYLVNLAHGGCGVLAPALSRVARADGRAVALALVSSLSAETAHLVQLAVAPGWQHRGLARRLLCAALDATAAARYTSMSLLVRDSNSGARRLYRDLGFEDRATFVALAASPVDSPASHSPALA